MDPSLSEPGDKMTPQFFQLSEGRIQDDALTKDRPYKIFFKDLFLFKENEMAAEKKERIMSRTMKIYQKTTFSSRMKSRSHLSQLAFYAEAGHGSYENLGLDPTLILRLTEGADRKKTLHEFICDQRNRFLLEYALSTKRNTIQMFEKLITGKENQLRKAELKLQADAMSFEEFLRENDQRSVDALKMAAQETISKLQMTTELKKASMEVQAIKSEIAKTEFLLKEYMKYGFFLLKLSPKHWQLQQSQKRAQASKSNTVLPRILKKFSTSSGKRDGSIDSDRLSFTEEHSARRGSQGQGQKKSTPSIETKKSSVFTRAESIASEDSLEFFIDDELLEFDLIPEIYFNEPEELLQVFTELEEQNLTLVQYSQDVDENLEDVNKREKCIQDKMLREEKLKEKQRHQEERLKAALERAVAQPKKKMGRRLIYRSKPLSASKQELLLVSDTRTKTQEEEYFFS